MAGVLNYKLKTPLEIKTKKERNDNWKFISSVFLSNDAGQFLGNFQLPGEKERLANYGVCYIFKTGRIGGGRLGGWFTARQGWF